MTARPRLLIHGAGGRMGQALLRLCAMRELGKPVAAVSRLQPSQRVKDEIAQFAASELTSVPPFDVAIDFSLPQAFDRILELCVERKAALVSGTTGLHAAQRAAIQAASASISVLWASNFSIGVAVLHALVARAAAALPAWNCDIVESHHVHKQDAPSGTALSLGAAAAAYGVDPRYVSLRAGDIVGEHLVQFTGSGERLELIHRATNRDIFAHGALQAAQWLALQPPGLYAMHNLLDAKFESLAPGANR